MILVPLLPAQHSVASPTQCCLQTRHIKHDEQSTKIGQLTDRKATKTKFIYFLNIALIHQLHTFFYTLYHVYTNSTFKLQCKSLTRVESARKSVPSDAFFKLTLHVSSNTVSVDWSWKLLLVEVLTLTHQHSIVEVHILDNSRIHRFTTLSDKHHLLVKMTSSILVRQQVVGDGYLVYRV